MKLKTLFFFVIILSFATSCNDDDESIPENGMSGTWKLKNVSGGLRGTNIDYNEGDVYWKFNLTDGILNVQNNILTTGPENIYSGLATGTYPYKIENENEIKILFIKGSRRGSILLKDNNLFIDDGLAADGFLTTFIR